MIKNRKLKTKTYAYGMGFALATATLSFNVACSHGPAVTEFPSTASSTEEVSKFDRDIQAAHSNGVDQLAPESYAQAVDHFNDAK